MPGFFLEGGQNSQNVRLKGQGFSLFLAPLHTGRRPVPKVEHFLVDILVKFSPNPLLKVSYDLSNDLQAFKTSFNSENMIFKVSIFDTRFTENDKLCMEYELLQGF